MYIYIYIYIYMYMSDYVAGSVSLHDYRPTQSIMYIPFQVNIFQKNILLIVQYKYLKSFSEDFILKNPTKI